MNIKEKYYEALIIEKQEECYDEIAECEDVKKIECNGYSGLHIEYKWYTAYMTDNNEFDFWIKW
jgi:hypothetical protein